MPDGTTIGVYYAEHEEGELEKFDDIADRHQDRRRYSRSQAVRDAMDMYHMVLETVDMMNWPEMSERDLRAAVRQSLLNENRRE